MSLAWESASPVPCLSLWERWPSAARTERANKEGPPPGGPSFSVSKNLSCHSEEHPKGTCFAARSDVGIRSPRPQARNSLPPSAREVARSAGGRDVDPPHPRCSSVGGDAHIAPHTAPAVSFRASAHTGVGIRIPAPAGAELPPPSVREVSTRSVDGGIVISRAGRAPPLHTSVDSLCAIRAGGCGHPPLQNHRRRMRHTHGRTESSAPTHGFPAAKYFQPAAKGRHLPLPLRGKGAI